MNNTEARRIGAAAPNAAELNGVLTAPTITRPAGWDTDNDGMPDAWEVAHGLNPNSPVTPIGSSTSTTTATSTSSSTSTKPASFPPRRRSCSTARTNNRYAVITNWKTNDGGVTAGSNWQPSRFDEAQINSGTVVVDAVGQHAGC